ncbi:MAG: FMN-binding protein [Verrucomicrobiota bacterium]
MVLFLVFSMMLGVGAVSARVFSSLNAALKKHFPKADVQRDVLYPTKAQFKKATELAGRKIPEGPIYRYQAYQGGKLIGTAYPDRHLVRTLAETVLILVTPEGAVREIDVLAFMEPEDYIPSSKWYDQFKSKKLDRELNLNRDITGVTGATLTARATTDAARRVLALHQVLSSSKEE